jgi:hypothetical protein
LAALGPEIEVDSLDRLGVISLLEMLLNDRLCSHFLVHDLHGGPSLSIQILIHFRNILRMSLNISLNVSELYGAFLRALKEIDALMHHVRRNGVKLAPLHRFLLLPGSGEARLVHYINSFNIRLLGDAWRRLAHRLIVSNDLRVEDFGRRLLFTDPLILAESDGLQLSERILKLMHPLVVQSLYIGKVQTGRKYLRRSILSFIVDFGKLGLWVD